MNEEARLIRWGGWAAIAAVAAMIGSMIAFNVATIGGGVLETKRDAVALVWIAEHSVPVLAFNWMFTVFCVLSIAAFLGFQAALRETRLPLSIGTALVITGLVSWIVYKVLYSGVALVLAPEFAVAAPAIQPAIGAAAIGLLTSAFAFDSLAFVVFALGVLLYSVAILETRAVPRWLGWFGLAVTVVAVLAGPLLWWEHLGGYAIVGLSLILIYVWYLGMGISILRARV